MKLKCLKRTLIKKRLLKLLKMEKDLIQDSCNRRNWQLAEQYLEKNKATMRAYKRIENLDK